MATELETAYARGYAAGRRRGKADAGSAADELWRAALVAAIPFAMQQDTWQRGKARISTLDDRIQFAAEIADCALHQAKQRGRA